MREVLINAPIVVQRISMGCIIVLVIIMFVVVVFIVVTLVPRLRCF